MNVDGSIPRSRILEEIKGGRKSKSKGMLSSHSASYSTQRSQLISPPAFSAMTGDSPQTMSNIKCFLPPDVLSQQ